MRTVNLAFDHMPRHLIDQYSLLEAGTTLGRQRYKFPIILDGDLDLRSIHPITGILQTLNHHNLDTTILIAGERKGCLSLILMPTHPTMFSFNQQEFIRKIADDAAGNIFDGDAWGADVHFTTDYRDTNELITEISRSFLYGAKECNDIVKNLINTYPKLVEDQR